jgi:hypothetical protein
VWRTALQYFIENGVRRAVAARELGLPTIRATLHEDGKSDTAVIINIGDLFSPKTTTSRFHARFVSVLQGMSSPQTRTRIPRIEVQPLGMPGQMASVPLAQVKLDP